MDKDNTAILKNVSNINDLCRICLLKTTQTTSLNLNDDYSHRIEGNYLKVGEILYEIINMKISLDNRFPSKVCSTCMNHVKSFYDFKMQFLNSQQILRDYFKEDLVEPDFTSVIEITQEDSEVVPVELISKQGKFDLKDVFVVEQGEEEPDNFDGFLSILGKEVSVSFVNNEPMIENVNEVVSKCNDEDKTNNINNVQKIDFCDVAEINKSEAPEKCSICESILKNKSLLEVHINTIHCKKKTRTFICEICGIILKTRSSHYHHMLKHGEKKHICTTCKKSYSNASALQLHITAVHNNTRAHLCTICGKQFNYSNALIYHTRIHTGERNYKCTYCDKTFRIQCGLDRHLRTHTGNRPYKCSFCEKAFRSKGELDCHEMTHTGYRPYHCKYCKKGFTKTYNLKLHLLGHKGQYGCSLCSRTFIELQYLQIHKQSSHSSDGIIDEDIDL